MNTTSFDTPKASEGIGKFTNVIDKYLGAKHSAKEKGAKYGKLKIIDFWTSKANSPKKLKEKAFEFSTLNSLK